jgi:hypothetical protein
LSIFQYLSGEKLSKIKFIDIVSLWTSCQYIQAIKLNGEIVYDQQKNEFTLRFDEKEEDPTDILLLKKMSNFSKITLYGAYSGKFHGTTEDKLMTFIERSYNTLTSLVICYMRNCLSSVSVAKILHKCINLTHLTVPNIASIADLRVIFAEPNVLCDLSLNKLNEYDLDTVRFILTNSPKLQKLSICESPLFLTPGEVGTLKIEYPGVEITLCAY